MLYLLFKDKNNKLTFTKILKPHQYYTTKELSNDNFMDSTTSYYDIGFKSKDSSGSVEYELSKGFFILVKKVSIELYLKIQKVI